MFKILNIYKIDVIAAQMSLYKSSSLFISKTYKADSAKFNKIRSLGGRKYR